MSGKESIWKNVHVLVPSRKCDEHLLSNDTIEADEVYIKVTTKNPIHIVRS